MSSSPEQPVSLHRPVTYTIRIPGEIAGCWSDWAPGMSASVETDRTGVTVTVLTVTLDQAALHGVLRRLYAMGIPILSVNRVDPQG